MFTHKYKEKADGCFEFGGKVSAKANQCLNNDSIKSFWKGFCCQAGDLEIKPCDKLTFSIGAAAEPDLNGNQYAVNVESTGLCIAGDSEKGLINGFMTLLQMIEVVDITDDESCFSVKCGSFAEKPGVANQMVHFCIFPETELWELEKFIKLAAALKYSHIILEFWGMLKYDCLKELGWSHAYSKNEIRPLIKTANELGLEVIPLFNHWGHASGSRVMHGKHVVLDQNPRLQPLFSEDGWNWNIGSDRVLKLLKSVREELIDLCGEGGYFHLGCDEPYNFEITPENYRVVTDYLNGVSDDLAACGRRAIVWGDMLVAKRESFNKNNSYVAQCESAEMEQKFMSALNRSIVIADWQYNVKEEPVDTSLVFKDHGFDTLICPWDRAHGGKSIAPCVNTALHYGMFGVIHTTWNTLSKGMRDVAETAWRVWNPDGSENIPSNAYFSTHTAKTLRCVAPVFGDYEKAGWSKKQIDSLMD